MNRVWKEKGIIGERVMGGREKNIIGERGIGERKRDGGRQIKRKLEGERKK